MGEEFRDIVYVIAKKVKWYSWYSCIPIPLVNWYGGIRYTTTMVLDRLSAPGMPEWGGGMIPCLNSITKTQCKGNSGSLVKPRYDVVEFFLPEFIYARA